MSTATSTQPSPTFNQFQDLLSKPLLAGVYCGLLDHYVMGNEEWNHNVIIGGTAAVGSSAGNLLSEYLAPAIGPMVLQNTSVYNGLTVAERFIQVGTASAVAYGLNRYVLKNDLNQEEMWMKKVGLIALSQFMAEYTMDYFNSQPLGYLM